MKMIFFSRTKERLSSHDSSEFSRNAQDVSGQLQYSKYTKGANKLVSNHSVPNHNLVNALIIVVEQLSQLETHPLAKPTRPTSEALDSSVKRTNFVCVFMYFLDPSMHAQTFVPSCHRRSFNYTFDQSHSHKNTFGCGFCFFWQPRFFKESFTCFSRHSIRAVLFNRFIYRFDTDFKCP